MVRLGPPLGWDDSYKSEFDKPESFLKLFHIKIIDGKFLKFTEVLEELVMVAVISEEVKAYLKVNE